MSRIIAYRNKQGKYNVTIIGNDPKQSILMSSNQGYERKAGVDTMLAALSRAINSCDTEYLTHAEYQKVLRDLRKRRK